MSTRVIRTACVIGLVATVGVSGVANAAKRPKPKAIPPVCNLITDAPGNGYVFNAGSVDTALNAIPGQGQDDALDILSADVATNSTTLTTVIRVKKAVTSSSNSPTGLQWQFSFNVGSTNIQTSVTSDPAGGVEGLWAYAATGSNSIGGPMTAVIDTVKNEIRASVPLADLSKQVTIKPGVRLDTLAASSSGVIVVPDQKSDPVFGGKTPIATLNTPAGQSASSTKTYVAGLPSCVTVGA